MTRMGGATPLKFKEYFSPSSVPGSANFDAVGHPDPNWPVSADRDPRERGPRPLNSNR